MHPTIEQIVRCAESAGVSMDESQRAAFAARLVAALGGTRVYMPLFISRPRSQFVRMAEAGLTHIPTASDIASTFGVHRTTAWRWGKVAVLQQGLSVQQTNAYASRPCSASQPSSLRASLSVIAGSGNGKT